MKIASLRKSLIDRICALFKFAPIQLQFWILAFDAIGTVFIASSLRLLSV